MAQHLDLHHLRCAPHKNKLHKSCSMLIFLGVWNVKPSVCRMVHFCTRLSCKVFPPRFALIRFPSNNSTRQKEERTKVPKMHRLLIFPASHPRRGKSRNWEKLETQTAAIRFKPVKVSAKFRLWQMMIVWPSRFFKIWFKNPDSGSCSQEAFDKIVFF